MKNRINLYSAVGMKCCHIAYHENHEGIFLVCGRQLTQWRGDDGKPLCKTCKRAARKPETPARCSNRRNNMPATKTPVELVCSVCHSIYFVQPYRSSKSKCCSQPCLQKYAARFAGANRIASLRGRGIKPHTYVKEYGRHQHRVVAERMIGRPLLPGEVVHHKDGNSKNNDPSNLEVTNQSDHVRIHWNDMMKKRKEKAGY